MIRVTTLALLSSCCLAAVAQAADIRASKAPSMVVAAPAAPWAGSYIGLHGGYGWADATYASPGGRLSFDPDGFLGGFHTGRNWQSGMWVFGLEGTNSFGSASDKVTRAGATTEAKITRLSTFTPRLGVANGNWLLYGRAGIAYAEVELTATSPGQYFREKTDHIGWTVGVGLEYMLSPNWILGLEYNYADLGTERYAGIAGAGVALDGNVDITVSNVMARLSYRFGGGGNPVTAFLFGPENPGGIWNGLYLGVHGGYGWGEQDAGVASNPGQILFAAGGTFGVDTDGGIGGIHIGHMTQRGNWVFGNEASFSWTGLKGTTTVPGAALTAPATAATITTELDWQATTTLRLGYSFGPWLLYGRGGAAMGEVKSRYNITQAGAAPAVWSESNAHVGWTLGGGLEYAMGNWIAGVEYNYVDLGTQRYGGFDSAGGDIDFKADLVYSSVLARLSYRFGEPAPVMAKY